MKHPKHIQTPKTNHPFCSPIGSPCPKDTPPWPPSRPTHPAPGSSSPCAHGSSHATQHGKNMENSYGKTMEGSWFINISSLFYTINVFKPIMQHLQSPCLDKTPWVSKAPSIFIDSNTHKIWPLVNLSPTCTEEGNLVGAKSMTQLWPNHVVNQKWIWMNLACDLLANFLLSP